MTNLKLKFPADFFNEEIRCGHTVTNEMKKIWAVELDLLYQFQLVCDKHNLRYCVDGGTMLGAVRHKGFIPWDDDIDIVMLREDYDKLCKVASHEFEYPYFFQTEKTDPGSMRGHCQLRNSKTTGILSGEKDMHLSFNQGIFIDIFELDDIPSDTIAFHKYVKRISRYKTKAFHILNYTTRYVHSNNFIKRPIKAFFHKLSNLFLNPNCAFKYYDLFEKELIRYKGINSEYVAKLFFTPFKEKYKWKRTWVTNTELRPFEMLMVPVPVQYEEFLDNFFGNWHEFVKGTSTHGGVIFDTEKSYKEILNKELNKK